MVESEKTFHGQYSQCCNPSVEGIADVGIEPFAPLLEKTKIVLSLLRSRLAHILLQLYLEIKQRKRAIKAFEFRPMIFSLHPKKLWIRK